MKTKHIFGNGIIPKENDQVSCLCILAREGSNDNYDRSYYEFTTILRVGSHEFQKTFLLSVHPNGGCYLQSFNSTLHAQLNSQLEEYNPDEKFDIDKIKERVSAFVLESYSKGRVAKKEVMSLICKLFGIEKLALWTTDYKERIKWEGGEL